MIAVSGRGKPIALAIKIPRVINIWVRDPRDPFNSLGDSSLMKLGTKTEKAPAASPNINLPPRITYSFLMRVRAQPIERIMFVK